MITDLQLRNLIDHFDSASTSAERDSRVTTVRKALEAVTCTREYRAWIDAKEFSGSRCTLPSELPVLDKLAVLGLADEQGLTVKINRLEDALLLTDGLWVPKAIRTFPFTDESEKLSAHVRRLGYDDWADVIVDPATGSGNHAIAIGGAKQRVALDISMRALSFVAVNQLLNGRSGMLIARNNIDNGLPSVLELLLSGKVLFVINMPFALSPRLDRGAPQGDTVLPRTADAGEKGARWTQSALKMLDGFARHNAGQASVRACVLCYSLGNQRSNHWHLPNYATKLFGSDKFTWELLEGEKLWRINGRKEQPNPMNLREGLPKKAECRYYVADDQRAEVRKGYQRLADSLLTDGWDVLGYGILDIEVA